MATKRDNELIKQLAARDALGMYEEALEEQQVDAILARRDGDSGYEEVFADIHQLSAALDDCQADWEGDAGLMAFAEEKSEGHGRTARGKWLVKFTAAAAMLLIFTAVWFEASNNRSTEDAAGLSRYVARTGELKRVELSDGSVITLNTDSQMLVDMNDNLRRVVLDRGEAYFEIVADPLRPFTVELSERSVTVLGTEFNLRRSVNGFKLSVLEGAVAVHRKDDRSLSGIPEFTVGDDDSNALLEPRKAVAGMQVEFDALTYSAVASRNLDVARLQGWRRGMLNFNGVSLAEIVAELNRYSGKPIELSDDVDGTQLVFASYHSDRIDLALKGLEFSLPIVVKAGFDKTVIHNDKNPKQGVGN